MANFKLYRIVTLTTSTPHNFVTGTTSTSAAPYSPNDKGVGVIFQNQSTGAFTIWVGGSDVAPLVGSTSTTGIGVMVAQNGIFQWQPRHAPSAVVMDEWYVTATSSRAIATAMLIKAV